MLARPECAGNLAFAAEPNMSPPLVEAETRLLKKSKQPTVAKGQVEQKPQERWTAQLQMNPEPTERRPPYGGIVLLVGSGGLFAWGIVVQNKNSEKRLT